MIRRTTALLLISACISGSGWAQELFEAPGRAVFPLPFDVQGTNTAATGDVDGDGDVDVVLAAFASPYTPLRRHRLLLNDGTGVLTDVSATHMPDGSVFAQDIALGDIDGDGDLDLVAAHGQRMGAWEGGAFEFGFSVWQDPMFMQNRVYVNDGRGVFTEAPSALPPALDMSYRVALQDFDGDGDLDLLFQNSYFASRAFGTYNSRGQNTLFLNDGSGKFTDATSLMPVDSYTENDIAVGDVDGDGWTDVVMGRGDAYFSDCALVWLRNNGQPAFTALPLTWSKDETPVALELVDVDGDGDLDCAVAIHYRSSTGFARSVRLLLNDGRGTFVDQSASLLPAEVEELRFPDSTYDVPGDLVSLDVEGDGDVDLLVAVYQRPFLLLNDGTGRFSRAPEEAVPVQWAADTLLHADSGSTRRSYPIRAAVGDLNGDGLLDVVGVHRFELQLLYSTGRADLDAVAEPPLHGDRLGNPAAADIDGDGVPDLVLAQKEGTGNPGEGVEVFLGDGFGGFRRVSSTHAPLLPNYGWVAAHADFGAGVALGDVDGDGAPDLLVHAWEVVGNASTSIQIYHNDGSGHFHTPLGRVPNFAWENLARQMELADLDADGDLDLLIVTAASATETSLVAQMRNDGTGTFTDVTAATMPAPSESFTRLCVGDLNGDGLPDLVVAARPGLPSGYGTGPVIGGAGQSRIYLNQGGGVFAEAPNLPADRDPTYDCAMADVDRDGDLDVILANLGDLYSGSHFVASNRLWINQGGGVFTDATGSVLPLDSDWTYRLVVGDFDADGWPDLFYANNYGWFSDHEVKFPPYPQVPFLPNRLMMNRNGQFRDETPAALTVPGDYTVSALALDYDLDGDVDVFLESAAPTNRTWTLANQSSQLSIRRQPRIGQHLAADVTLQPSVTGRATAIYLAVAPTAVPPRVVPGIGGALRLDPVTLVPWGAQMLPAAGGRAVFDADIAPLPALFGLEFYVQAGLFDGQSAWFSNALHETVNW